mgnify:CR=1 FL=1
MVEGVEVLECDLGNDGVFDRFTEAIDDFVGGGSEMVEMGMLVVKTL